MLAPNGVDCEIPHRLERGTNAIKDAGPRIMVDCEIPHRLERETTVNKDAGPQREVDCEIPRRLERETSANEDVGPRRGWIVRSHISWRGEQNILYKGVETSSYQTRFKNLEGNPEKRKLEKDNICYRRLLGAFR